MRAMLLAAGLGTRLKPFTDQHPKALAIVNGRSLLQRNIDYLKGSGVTDIIINVHHFSEEIVAFIQHKDNFGINIRVSNESDRVLETGGGLMKASWFFSEATPFILMNVDILTDLDIRGMYKQHLESIAIATLAVSMRPTSRYLLFDNDNLLSGWRNVKTSEERISRQRTEYIARAFSGIHIISPRIFQMIKLTGKFSMIDVYLELAKHESIIGFDHSGSKFIDVGTPQSIIDAEKVFK